ncbi:Transcriptional regulator, AcrR-family [Leptospira biflexa serovar Patoc strain 'Patoc 1 (Ames)']|jgi:AcrR family transcriptional regulator|uniref:Putative transcriptional regulator, TetR family n=1 Tax=Leptospira biflexa serovar Patoc (strain Patoc 1 / ATCC 23582 / Paris) TaxID=456481 RepID=B0SPG3_LEPBP|nr:TetR family transcriptional regulator [Leptospira biflexa]ABZ95373.1 Transcriptional regulator, AcrR-family [Leptospira biflexa serovar Patoc strain 'Patoc 1 (Ames)']ABZ99069.1 Putative transcriptional regulator, TetR family [Leptospira biflexa serovar Patoc strain 'Patoc 1 (Paris)']TGM31917.1 TetR/AcrR family transcriptional regulator [Leptospira biflexa]TGM37058.1 TetR/AcrR family transcriptional regulator [Leptospira biflexa]TGM56207.1 TetR/AcrR family transcriptional regulator [Leptospi
MSRAQVIERSPKKRAVLEKDKLSKRTSIIQAAATLLQKKDWAELSMDEVAKRAKIAKGTLYLYFPTKEDLCLRIHSADYESWFMDLNEFLINTPKMNADIFSNWFVNSMDRHSRFLKLLPIVPTILEKNASIQTIREFKTNLKNQITSVLPLIIQYFPFLTEQSGFLFLMQCHALAVGSWSHGFPSNQVKEAVKDTELEMFVLDYKKFLEISILNLLKGHSSPQTQTI